MLGSNVAANIRFERQSLSESASAPHLEGTAGQSVAWLGQPLASADVRRQAASADAQGSVELIAAGPKLSQLSVRGQEQYTGQKDFA